MNPLKIILLMSFVSLGASEHKPHHSIDIPSPTTVRVEEIRAHTQEIRSISKRKIACLVAVSSITGAVLAAAVTMSIHFSNCGK